MLLRVEHRERAAMALEDNSDAAGGTPVLLLEQQERVAMALEVLLQTEPRLRAAMREAMALEERLMMRLVQPLEWLRVRMWTQLRSRSLAQRLGLLRSLIQASCVYARLGTRLEPE